MIRMTFMLFLRLLVGFSVTVAIPPPFRKSLTPCQEGVQAVLGHDDALALMDSESCRRPSDTPMPPKLVWLTSNLFWMSFSVIAVTGLALAASRVYKAVSFPSDEHESLENGLAKSTSSLLDPYLPSSNHPQYQSMSASDSHTQTHQQAHRGSRALTAQPSQASLAVSNIHSFAPSFTDSPRCTTKSLDGSNSEQDIDILEQTYNLNSEQDIDIRGRTSDRDPHSDLGALIHPLSTTIDDRTSTTLQTPPTNGSHAHPVSQAQQSGRRAETAPNIIFRSVSRQLTLIRSLMGRPSMRPTRHVDIRILGVALSWDHEKDKALPGPAHDIQWLETLFENHQYVRFSYLLNSDATYEGIRQRLEETYESATADTYLIVYCAGHGTENNSLELYDPSSEPINEAVMNKWIVELRRKTGKHIPVYVVFDFCRASPVEPDTNLDRDIYIIWACSLLQDALDLDLSSEGEYGMYLPRSCFLMALILAAHDTSTNPLFPSWKHFATRLKELVNVVRGGDYWGSKHTLPWPRCRCKACLGGDICANARNSEERHLFQVVSLSTLEENPDFAAVARFVANHFPLRIQRVVRHVSNNHWVMFFNPVRIAANRGSLKPRKPEYLRNNICVPSQITVRHMTVPIGLSRV